MAKKQDLPNATVVTALQNGYRQEDTEERQFAGFKRNLRRHSWETEAEPKRRRTAQTDTALKVNPRHCDTRAKRPMARVDLAFLHRHKTGAATAIAWAKYTGSRGSGHDEPHTCLVVRRRSGDRNREVDRTVLSRKRSRQAAQRQGPGVRASGPISACAGVEHFTLPP